MRAKNNDDNMNYEYYEYQTGLDCKYIKDSKIENVVKSGVIIDDNTVYEFDEECIECLKNKKKIKQ